MKYISSICAIVILTCLHTFAQNEKKQPDFSGEWVLDAKASFPGDFEDYVLVISQFDAELKMERSFKFNGISYEYSVTLFTDKRGETNLEGNPKEEIKSKTFWKKNVLVREIVPKATITSGFNYIVERYTLSTDCNTIELTRTTRFVSKHPNPNAPADPDFDRVVRFVFIRKPELAGGVPS